MPEELQTDLQKYPHGDIPLPEEPGDGYIYVEKQVRVPTFTMSYEHTHKYCEVFYLRTGACTYKVNRGSYHLTAGDIFIVAAGEPHSTRYEGLVNCERYIVFCRVQDLPSEFSASHPEAVKLLSRSGKVILKQTTQDTVCAIFDEMLRESILSGEYFNDFLLLDALHLILLLLRDGICSYEQASVNDRYGSDIEHALKYIALNYTQPLTLETVAARCSLSATYFSRKFRLVTGATFKEYLNMIRLRQATQRLLTTDDTITKIADDCGFNGSNYFKDVFRKTIGLSPREYRKQSKASPVPLYGSTASLTLMADPSDIFPAAGRK